MPTERQKGNAGNKAEDIGGKNPNLYRKDKFGNVLYKPSYGKDSEMGWEIDHSKPKSKGGTDHPNNLQIMQTTANRQKSNDYPVRKPLRQRDLRRRW